MHAYININTHIAYMNEYVCTNIHTHMNMYVYTYTVTHTS